MTSEVQHVPDVLETIAQLPNDEVFTSPRLSNMILDLLPEHVWHEPKYRWLDPATKSGAFLRESARRLMSGLTDWEPDALKRREHIYRNMLFGCAISQLTGEVTRRSLYHSMDATGSGLKDANLKDLIVRFDHSDGHVQFIPTEHTFKDNRCTICNAPEDLERGSSRENYAYPFIHGTYPTKELSEMKFDVIVGNPPYQIDSDGNTRTMPVYQRFVQKAIEMKPRYVVMITPSRWFGGGLGLDDFRASMLRDSSLRKIVDYPKLFEVFPGVEIKGGVSYFLWDRDHKGDCEFVTVRDGVRGEPMIRSLADFDVLVRDNVAIPILNKVRAAQEPTLDQYVATRVPFGLQANFRKFKHEPFPGSVKVFGNKFMGYTDPSEITKNIEWLDDWKVLIPKATDGHGRIPASVTPAPLVAGPGEICTDTYLVVWRTQDKDQALRIARFLRTKFARLLIHLRKPTQDNKPSTFAFVPVPPLDREWTDEDLYRRYRLTAEEVEYVESQIRPIAETEKASE